MSLVGLNAKKVSFKIYLQVLHSYSN